MGRTVGSSGPKTEEAIRKAGLRLIHEHGYAAMTMRELATTVGIQPGSLYRYVPSKQDLLMELLSSNMKEMLRQWDEVSAGVQGPAERLRRFVKFHIDYHTARRREVFICSMELRSLEPGNYKVIVGLRRTYERHLIDILGEGVRAGVFAIGDPQIAAFGILAMLTGVCAWFRPTGRLAKDELADGYVQLICRGIMSGHDAELAVPALPPQNIASFGRVRRRPAARTG